MSEAGSVPESLKQERFEAAPLLGNLIFALTDGPIWGAGCQGFVDYLANLMYLSILIAVKFVLPIILAFQHVEEEDDLMICEVTPQDKFVAAALYSILLFKLLPDLMRDAYWIETHHAMQGLEVKEGVDDSGTLDLWMYRLSFLFDLISGAVFGWVSLKTTWCSSLLNKTKDFAALAILVEVDEALYDAFNLDLVAGDYSTAWDMCEHEQEALQVSKRANAAAKKVQSVGIVVIALTAICVTTVLG